MNANTELHDYHSFKVYSEVLKHNLSHLRDLNDLVEVLGELISMAAEISDLDEIPGEFLARFSATISVSFWLPRLNLG